MKALTSLRQTDSAFHTIEISWITTTSEDWRRVNLEFRQEIMKVWHSSGLIPMTRRMRISRDLYERSTIKFKSSLISRHVGIFFNRHRWRSSSSPRRQTRNSSTEFINRPMSKRSLFFIRIWKVSKEIYRNSSVSFVNRKNCFACSKIFSRPSNRCNWKHSLSRKRKSFSGHNCTEKT